MAVPQPESDRPVRPLALVLAAVVAAGAISLVPLVDPQYRPWNFTAFGAAGLFVAARGGRYGLRWSILFALASKLGSDLLNYAQKGYDPDYLPFSEPDFALAVYGCFLVAYPVLGWTLRRTENPVRIAGVAVAGSVVFFLVTNFTSWLHQDLPYPQTAGGLLQSYVNGLPFFGGTLAGDLTFAAVLFGLHAVTVRLAAAQHQPVPVAERS